MVRFHLVEREDDEESGSSGEEEEEVMDVAPPQGGKSKITIALQANKNEEVCKVCGGKGHRAGFVGATYVDCPMKPCYLCKQPGHTTATCPHRITAAYNGSSSASNGGPTILAAIKARESGSDTLQCLTLPTPRYQVEAAIYKLHTRRCCTLEFHPQQDNIVVSGDKKGHIAIWNFERVHDRTVLDGVHRALCNSIKFLPWLDAMSCCTASSDGTVKVVDLETGSSRPVLVLNPGGWVKGAPWHMAYGCDVSERLRLAIVGDSNGVVHLLDPRANGPVSSVLLHKKGTKVVSVSCHPQDPSLVLTAGNDYLGRIMDLRQLSSAGASTSTSSDGPSTSAAGAAAHVGKVQPGSSAIISHLEHPKVINAAYFSPLTGRKVLTTCQDNRIRVWDSLLYADGPPCREIVHSHDFNRYLTPFKAEWDAKDPTESRFVIGRYISEDFGGIALHPVDIMDASTGRLLQQLTDTNFTTISPVNKPHPRKDVIISGSSRSLYLWAPAQDATAAEDVKASSGASGSNGTGTHPGVKRASSSFVYFDADPGGKKAAGGGKKQKPAADDSDDDD